MTKKSFILISFILLKFILQYSLISPEYDLHRDEYLHLDQANHLAWGYLSVPPLTSWTSYIIKLLGNSVFWVKFFPALYGALTMLIVWKAIEELGGDLFALSLGAACILFSVLLRLNTLYQPNSFDVLAWTTLYFVLIKYLKTENEQWIFIGAVVFAVGFLNKYNVIFLILGIIPALLLSEHRKILARSKLYMAVFIGILLIAPNLFWQFNNNFPVFYHLRALASRQLVHVDRLDFLKSQIFFNIGSIVVLLASFYALLFYPPFKKYRIFFYSIVFTLLIFIYFKAKDYYAIGIYPIYYAFGSVFLSEILHRQYWEKLLKPVIIGIPILFFTAIYHVAFPNKSPEYIIQHSEQYKKSGMLRWEDGKDHLLPQDYADMLGWSELAQKVDSAYLGLPNKDNTLVLCDNYGQAGAINYYTKQNIIAVSFNADYLNWFDLSKKYEHVIRVKEQGNVNEELQETAPFFQTSRVFDSITNKYAREAGTTIFAFGKAKIDIRERLKKEIDENKNSQ